MKKQIVLFLAVAIIYALPARAQDSLHIKVGFFFNPQSSISLQKSGKLFSPITPLFFVVQFSKGNAGVNVMYNATFNNLQGVYFCKLHKNVGTYLLINKRLLSKGGYASIGLTRGLAEGRAVGFAEFGSSWDNWSPIIDVGLIIPFTFKVR